MKNHWFIHTNDTDKQLFVSRPKPNPSGAFSPCNMSPDDVDYEMSLMKKQEDFGDLRNGAEELRVFR